MQPALFANVGFRDRGFVNVIIFGSTGMVGTGVVLECLSDTRVRSVLSIVRTPSGMKHPKFREIVRSDFFDYSDVRDQLRGLDACFFCLGVSAFRMDEATYHHLTYDLTLAAAEALCELNPAMTFCYVSGVGTDDTERGRVMWARVKGKTENALLAMPFKAYMFRPGYIHPVKGTRSKTRLYRLFYAISRPAYPLLKRIAPRYITTTEAVGQAMIEVAASGYPKHILHNADINVLARDAQRAINRLTTE